MPCNASLAFEWFTVPGSPYGNQAYCEAFPRQPANLISPPPPPAAPPLFGTNASSNPLTGGGSGTGVSLTSSSPAPQYYAQVGKSINFQPNYDNILQAVLSTFVMITQDNYDVYMKV